MYSMNIRLLNKNASEDEQSPPKTSHGGTRKKVLKPILSWCIWWLERNCAVLYRLPVWQNIFVNPKVPSPKSQSQGHPWENNSLARTCIAILKDLFTSYFGIVTGMKKVKCRNLEVKNVSKSKSHRLILFTSFLSFRYQYTLVNGFAGYTWTWKTHFFSQPWHHISLNQFFLHLWGINFFNKMVPMSSWKKVFWVTFIRVLPSLS